jgi:hypothetical protein
MKTVNVYNINKISTTILADMALLGRNIKIAKANGWTSTHPCIPGVINMREVYNDLVTLQDTIDAMRIEIGVACGIDREQLKLKHTPQQVEESKSVVTTIRNYFNGLVSNVRK